MRRLATTALLAFLLPSVCLPSSGTIAPPSFSPQAAPPIDLEPWFIGDSWRYATTIQTASPDGTRTTTTLDVTTSVAEVRVETVGNGSYTLYNATSSGSASASGVLSLTGPGANPFSISGPLTGWSWSDRSNLASVAVNQTTNLTGTVQVGFLIFPVSVDAATTARNRPALEEFDFPLELGDTWSFDGIVNTTGVAVISGGPFGTTTQDLSGDTNASLRSWFNATEDATVPAGTFVDAARIHTVAPDGNATDRWYHSDAKAFVKMEVHRETGANDYFHLWTNLTSYSLVSPAPWPGSVTLTPSRVTPGGALVASGTAPPNEDLVVSIPATGATYPVRANASGGWSLPILAPSADDFTPANADVGSHGVILEPAVSPSGWDAETLQLILPDLYAAPGELIASDFAPIEASLVWLNATVHAGPAIEVPAPINVSFTVDGAEISRSTLGLIAANGSAAASATWTAAPAGTHLVAFIIDPDDDIRESNEANNSVEIAVLVRGPDLSPWNITIDAETTATYADPSSVGFVSSPIQGRVGDTVNISFEAASVGPASVAQPFEVEVVETVGLRGPPKPGWRFSANSTATLPPGAHAGPWMAVWAVPTSPGFYHLNVTVDATDRVNESSEANNTFVVVVSVSGPDYVVAAVSGPRKVTVSAPASFPVDVRNDGQLAGGIAVPLVAYEGTSPTPFHSASVPSLAVGESVTVEVPWTSPSAASMMDLRFVIDPGNALPEMIETNNELLVSLDVRDRPATAISWAGPNVTTDRLFVRGSTQFVLTATDSSGDGLATNYRVDGGSVQTYVVPLVLPEGPHSIAYWSEDNLGGVEAEHTLAVTVDETPPTSAAEVGAITGNRTAIRTTVSLNASDGSGVGVSSIRYRLDNGSWQTYTTPFLVEGFGNHVVEFRATDLLGNEEPLNSVTVNLFPIGVPQLYSNFKPLLAAAFAAILVILALVPRPALGYGKGPRFLIGMAFVVAEAATGISSYAWRTFEISPYSYEVGGPSYALGVGVDVALFLMGILAILFARRRFEGVAVQPKNG